MTMMRLIGFYTVISDALAARLGTISLEAQSKLEQDTAKKEAKAEAKAEAEMKKKMASQVRYSLPSGLSFVLFICKESPSERALLNCVFFGCSR